MSKCSSQILFSAAYPEQGGFGHINEKPHYYWKEQFESLGYDCHDIIRDKIKNHNDVPIFYKQNIFLFIKKDKITKIANSNYIQKDFELVHRDTLTRLLNKELSTREIFSVAPKALLKSFKRKLKIY